MGDHGGGGSRCGRRVGAGDFYYRSRGGIFAWRGRLFGGKSTKVDINVTTPQR
jgi:hypothetical protein